jgi:hypothetical protein
VDHSRQLYREKKKPQCVLCLLGTATRCYMSRRYRRTSLFITILACVRWVYWVRFLDQHTSVPMNMGNVFFAAEGVIYEYPHDGDSPIATLQAFGSVACSADPAAAKLAVADGNGGVLVFNDSAKHGWLLPKVYSLSFEVKSCAYDGKGDLFAGGVSSTAAKFAELAAGSKVFSGITLNQPIASPGQLQWDGHNLALEDAGALPSVIYQFALSGSSGYKVDSTTLNDEYEEGVRQFWIYRGLIAGTTSDSVALWKYPAGGSPTREIRSSGTPYGVAVSVAPPH